MVRIHLNEEERQVPEGSTILELLLELSLKPEQVAVELNRALVRRAQHGTTVLSEGDRLELVTLVGGG